MLIIPAYSNNLVLYAGFRGFDQIRGGTSRRRNHTPKQKKYGSHIMKIIFQCSIKTTQGQSFYYVLNQQHDHDVTTLRRRVRSLKFYFKCNFITFYFMLICYCIQASGVLTRIVAGIIRPFRSSGSTIRRHDDVITLRSRSNIALREFNISKTCSNA